MSDLPTYEDVLGMLAEKAGDGSVSAMVTLERALRTTRKDEEDPLDRELDEILKRE